MPNIASAKKRARQTEKRNAHNASLRSELRTMIKKVRKAIDNGDKDVAASTFASAQSRIDSIADKKIIHKNSAARQKSKLSRAIKSMA
ncbi:30S ribosomal protein S20 [Burkholderiales bacterium]|jgi:small subunit ribosomal protein S20|nr:30S ribosomal protein S20 [Burkholderiales bacterium]